MQNSGTRGACTCQWHVDTPNVACKLLLNGNLEFLDISHKWYAILAILCIQAKWHMDSATFGKYIKENTS